jgi:hypothetical protein
MELIDVFSPLFLFMVDWNSVAPYFGMLFTIYGVGKGDIYPNLFQLQFPEHYF